MKKMQYRSLKYVHRDFKASYTKLRSCSNKNLFCQNRIITILCEVYRCIMKLNPMYLQELFTIAPNIYNTRGKIKLEQPSCKYVKFGKEKVSYHGAILWNALPDHVKVKDTFIDFKRLLNMWKGPRCSCTYCNMCVFKQI